MKRLSRIGVGDEVKFTEEYLDFWHNEAFNMCSRAGTISSDDDAKDFVIRKIISLGYRYKAVVVSTEYSNVTGDAETPIPGFKVKIILPHGLIDETIVGVNNISLYRKKKRKKS